MMRTQLNVRSINYFAFLLLLSFKSLITKAQTPIYVGSNCQNTTKRPLSSAYQTNLNSILSWISSDAATSKGYNHTMIGNNTLGDDDDVYGLYDCRGDVDGNFCQFCVSSAAKEAPQRCPNRVSAMVWYDFCIVRYSNENFFGKVLTYPAWHYFGKKSISNSAEIQKGEEFMRGLILKATKETNQLFYMDEFSLSSSERRYGLVHCSRDLSNEGCRQCLEAMLAEVPKCCQQKLGWQVWSGSCVIKYDDHMFYLNNQTSLVPLPNLQTVCWDQHFYYVLVSIASGAGIELEKKLLFVDELILDTLPLSSHHNVQIEEALNADLPTIPLITILKSTNNFSEASKLGEGGFGPVYKGVLPDGRQIAVKRLSKSEASGQGSEEFMNEVRFIAKLQHRNLVRLLACCLEENEKILVYEYMPNASLNFHLFEITKALLISNSGYMAPEYAMAGLFSVKSDVFSFGVLVLEIITGKKNNSFYLSEHGQTLLLYVWKIWCAGNCLELMDPVLEKSFIASEVVKCIHIGLLCVQQDAADRPTMSTVVVMLGSDTMTLPKPNHPAFSVGRMTSKEASTSRSSKNLSINDVTVSNILPSGPMILPLNFPTGSGFPQNSPTSKAENDILCYPYSKLLHNFDLHQTRTFPDSTIAFPWSDRSVIYDGRKVSTTILRQISEFCMIILSNKKEQDSYRYTQHNQVQILNDGVDSRVMWKKAGQEPWGKRLVI
ncbi:hypothetical protein VNO77_39267 [Canavalia gladiata]|uniref:non-specific serine/threonine protein kinase n=1 Tax=Canavalia gladiata TaxID=3824 RepID=A0AAN9PZL8_CANGL